LASGPDRRVVSSGQYRAQTRPMLAAHIMGASNHPDDKSLPRRPRARRPVSPETIETGLIALAVMATLLLVGSFVLAVAGAGMLRRPDAEPPGSDGHGDTAAAPSFDQIDQQRKARRPHWGRRRRRQASRPKSRARH
jgi:hypothetical protein